MIPCQKFVIPQQWLQVLHKHLGTVISLKNNNIILLLQINVIVKHPYIISKEGL